MRPDYEICETMALSMILMICSVKAAVDFFIRGDDVPSTGNEQIWNDCQFKECPTFLS